MALAESASANSRGAIAALMPQSVDGTAVAAIFQAWAKAMTPVEAGQAVAMDSKALGSTVRDCYGTQQDFVMVVSACVQS